MEFMQWFGIDLTTYTYVIIGHLEFVELYSHFQRRTVSKDYFDLNIIPYQWLL